MDEYLHIPFDHILTVCDHANENCPYIPSQTALRIHHNFTDPSKQVSENEEEIKDAFAATREEIKNFALAFVQQHRLKKVSNAQPTASFLGFAALTKVRVCAAKSRTFWLKMPNGVQ